MFQFELPTKRDWAFVAGIAGGEHQRGNSDHLHPIDPSHESNPWTAPGPIN